MGYHYRALEKLCLKRMSVKDEDLELLADSFPYFKELVLVCCDGFGTSGLAVIANKCRQRLHVKWALTRKLTSSDLEAADLDNDKVVSAAEFIVYKLKEMGTISEEDISVVMEGFKNLDVDQSGTLTAADLLLLESSQPQG